METVDSKGDALSQPLASASATAAKQEPLKDRIPIIWTGKAKDNAGSSKAAEAPETTEKQQTPEPKPLQRMKPNAAFLLNVVADAQRGNERLCADEATNASLTVLGQVRSSFMHQFCSSYHACERPCMICSLLTLQPTRAVASWHEESDASVIFCFAGS